MRVDVFVNKQAGLMNAGFTEEKLTEKIRTALFRCELFFYYTRSIQEMSQRLVKSCKDKADHILLCGGDGTLSFTLRTLIPLKQEGVMLPVISVIPLGTANDFANETGVSSKIETAAHLILEGRIEEVDVLEFSSGGKKAYILTAGGIGLAADTAKSTNELKTWVKQKARAGGVLGGMMQVTLKALSSKIYDIVLIRELMNRKKGGWQIRLEMPEVQPFETSAPIILFNNQSNIGKGFKPAPFTKNNDGFFNVFLFASVNTIPLMKSLLDVRFGRVPSRQDCPSFETSFARVVATPGSQAFDFFGDGEILFSNVRDLEIRCLHPGVRVTRSS